MPRFEPIPIDQLSDRARSILDAGIATGMYEDGTGLPPVPMRVMAYNTTVLEATAAQSTALWHRGLLEDRIKELVRIRSAQVNGCDVCASVVKEPGVSADDVACLVAPGGDRLDERETAALELIPIVAGDHHAVDEQALRRLADVFSPAEIVELIYHVCVMLGQHRFHHIFRSFEAGDPVVAFAPGLVDQPAGAIETAGR